MTSTNNTISHSGIIENTEFNTIHVKIITMSACASCKEHASCSISETKEKIIEIKTSKAGTYHKGQQVKVYMNKSLGHKALLLGYIFPFFILITTLLIMTENGISELISGLSAIIILFPYFLCLYLFKSKLARTFNFSVK